MSALNSIGGGYISIHAPHTGRDYHEMVSGDSISISIHAPHTGRDFIDGIKGYISDFISIHAPHTGRDFYLRGK